MFVEWHNDGGQEQNSQAQCCISAAQKYVFEQRRKSSTQRFKYISSFSRQVQVKACDQILTQIKRTLPLPPWGQFSHCITMRVRKLLKYQVIFGTLTCVVFTQIQVFTDNCQLGPYKGTCTLGTYRQCVKNPVLSGFPDQLQTVSGKIE